MKKTLLLLSLAVASFSFGQDVATNSDIAENKPNANGDGYTFLFKASPDETIDHDALNCKKNNHNRFGTAGFTSSLDKATETLVLAADGTQASGTASYNLTKGNCDLAEIDVTNATKSITVNVKSSREGTEFRILAASNVGGQFALGDAGAAPEYKTVGTSTEEISFVISDSTYRGSGNVELNYARIIGFAIQIKGDAATLTFDDIKLGADAKVVGLDEFVSNEASFSVYPNPVTDGVINFSETVEEVELYNLQGNLVKAGSNVNKLSVDGLESGIYVVQSTQGYKRVVIK